MPSLFPTASLLSTGAGIASRVGQTDGQCLFSKGKNKRTEHGFRFLSLPMGLLFPPPFLHGKLHAQSHAEKTGGRKRLSTGNLPSGKTGPGAFRGVRSGPISSATRPSLCGL